jgi:hypothetical protein
MSPPHALGGRVGSDQIGPLLFERLELTYQCVIFGVGDLRLIEDVIAVSVVRDRRAKLLGSSDRIGVGHGSG